MKETTDISTVFKTSYDSTRVCSSKVIGAVLEIRHKIEIVPRSLGGGDERAYITTFQVYFETIARREKLLGSELPEQDYYLYCIILDLVELRVEIQIRSYGPFYCS